MRPDRQLGDVGARAIIREIEHPHGRWLAVLGRDGKTNEWLLWNHAWIQEDVLDLRKDIAERLRDFEQDGDLNGRVTFEL